mgnify:CR=1 FL=1
MDEPPWQLKRYEDEVFTTGGFTRGDGRTRTEPTKNYGTGGLLTEKRYLLSSTWNAPKEAFDEPGDFSKDVASTACFSPFTKPCSSSACIRSNPSWPTTF